MNRRSATYAKISLQQSIADTIAESASNYFAVSARR